MRVLLVKLSSLGDVIHNLPVVSDLVRAQPDIELHWLTEAPYVELLSLHPGVQRALPLHLRQLKKNWFSPAAWQKIGADKSTVQTHHYERVLDTQGLLKSAWVARWGGAPIAGYDAASAREPLAARFYDQGYPVARDLHAVARNRMLAASAFGYELTETVDYGLNTPQFPPVCVPDGGFAVFLHATSRADKTWPAAHWIALAQKMQALGLKVVLPWGSETEKAVSLQLAAAMPGAIVPPALTLRDAAGLLSRAAAVVGVDTGLAHLAVALRRPTVGIYCTTSPRLTGLLGGGVGKSTAINLGDGSRAKPDCPAVELVWNTVQPLLAGAA